MKRKWLVPLALAMTAAVAFSGCGKETKSENKETTENKETKQQTEEKSEESSEEKTENTTAIDTSYQFAEAQSGDTIAEVNVKDYGTIKIRLFQADAPKAVENFVTHAKEGYYNGLSFHRVINEFMIQGGDPKGDGTGGESIWGEAFEDEFSNKLYPWRGALCMANSGENTNGSQFFIVQKNPDEATAGQLESGGWPQNLIETYKEKGGTLWLYKKHTVFGQVLEGMEVVDKIAAAEVDSNDKPNTDVIIDNITITQAE